MGSFRVPEAARRVADSNYPNTATSGWLCEQSQDGNYNNSMFQGELFYLQFTSQSQAASSLSVNGVTCPTTEDVELGTTTVGGSNYSGSQAIINDMTGAVNPATACSAFARN